MIKSGAKSILIDGFPRALDQAEMFENNIKPCQKVSCAAVGDHNVMPAQKSHSSASLLNCVPGLTHPSPGLPQVIFFDCPEEVMESRLLKRGETSGRSDDNAETIRKRFKTFVEQSLPVIEHYEKQGKAYKISATQTPDEVFVEVVKALEA
jgi:adenylate kinase family enzyme